jgi:Glycosyltransferase family 87
MLPDMEGRGEGLSVAPAVNRHPVSRSGLRGALRRARDPLLFGVLPLAYAIGALTSAHEIVGVVGFDFRGTLWEPARALLEGSSIYPEPTRAAIELGNPAVYPPFVVMLVAPLGLLPVDAASVGWGVLLAVGVALSLWLLRVRDWRCYTVAVASAPVLDGVLWGNLSILMLVPVALAWRYRERASIVGLAVGAAVAAKLFVWPLIIWLLLTKRFRAAAWAAGSAVVLVLGAWATIGFEGFLDYPALLRELQNVYAQRSLSLATVAGGFGAPVQVAATFAALAGFALLGLAASLATRPDGDRRAFSVVVVASVVATPIVWLHYLALLFVPIAIRWPRLAAAWFFGFVVLLAKHLPGVAYVAPEPCCRPAEVPKFVWEVNHGIAEPWQALGVMAVIAAALVALVGPRGLVDVPRRRTSVQIAPRDRIDVAGGP